MQIETTKTVAEVGEKTAQQIVEPITKSTDAVWGSFTSALNQVVELAPKALAALAVLQQYTGARLQQCCWCCLVISCYRSSSWGWRAGGSSLPTPVVSC